MNRSFVAASVPGKAAAGSCSPASPSARGTSGSGGVKMLDAASETDEFMRDDGHVFVQRIVTLSRYRTMDTGRGRFPFELPVRRLLLFALRALRA